MNREILRLANPKTQKYVPSVGGKPEVTMEDVCLILAKLPRHIALYARMKICGEWNGQGYGSMFHEVLDALRALGGCLEINERMPAAKFDRMMVLVLYEALQGESNRCPTCRGTKSRLVDDSYITCDTCGGTGVMKITDTYKAKILGYCDARSYQRWGDSCYQELLREIYRYWDSAINEACQTLK